MNHLLPLLMLFAPWPLLATGLVVGVGADSHPRMIRRLTAMAAWWAFGCALSAALVYAFGARGSATYLAIPLPAHLGAFQIGINADILTTIMLLLVAFVGMIVARYARVYMAGDAHEGRFHRWLALTLGSFLTLVVANNIWGFWVSWVVTSLFLHELLAFYRDRPGAVLAARKKYLLHRIADVSLLAAFVLIVRNLHATQWHAIARAAAVLPGPVPPAILVAGGLIILSAILKSAQFPTHGWLIQVMEAPTPVSALMHAGIIYTGAFLILRMSPVVSRIGWAGDVLVVVGLVSIMLASLTMMTITNIKGALAYSTCAQMGFMLMECGLGLYSIAVLHIIAHSVYKAHAFLSSGSVVEYFRAPPLSLSIATSLWRTILGIVVAAGMTIGMGAAFGVAVVRQPALVVMALILTVGTSQLLLQGLNMRNAGAWRLLPRLAGLSALVCAAYFGLHLVFVHLLGSSVPADPLHAGIVQKVLLAVIALAFLTLLMIQQFLPRLSQRPFWRAAYVHLYNGFYADTILTGFVRKLGPTPIGLASRHRMIPSDVSREV